MDIFRRQDAVPRETSMLRHVREQRDISVGQRGYDEATLQSLQPGNRVGPWLQPVPDAVEASFLIFAKTFDFEFLQDLFQRHPMQNIEFCPRQFAVPDTVQGWAIDGPPCVRQRGPTHVEPFRLSELLAFGDHAGAPINYGAEDIKGKDFNRNCRWFAHFRSLLVVIYPHTGNLNGKLCSGP